MATLNEQIKVLYDQGFTFEQIAENLDKEVEAVEFAYRSAYGNKKREQSFAELQGDLRFVALKVLGNIMENDEAPYNSRVRAAEVIICGKGVLPEVDAGALSEALRNMKAIRDGVSKVEEGKIVDMASAVG